MAITALTPPSATTNGTASTSLILPYPTGMTSSTMMVLFASVNSGTVATLPAGWTSVYAANSGGTNPSLLVAIKQATGSEPLTLIVTTPSAKSTGQIIAFDGVDLTTPQDVAAIHTTPGSGSSTLTFSGLTTTRTGCALVYAAAHGNGSETATAPTTPAAFTETGDNTGVGGWSGTMGYLIWSGSGATGSVSVTFSGTTNGNGNLLALRPAGAAAAPSAEFLMFMQ